MRGLSVLMVAATVLAVYFVGREVCAPPSAIPLGAAAIVAFNPQFLFISSVVNNDNLANLSAALATWMLVRLLVGRQDRRTLIGLGVSLGIGLLAKQNMLVFLPLAILVLSYLSWRQRSPRLLLRGGLILCISLILIAGWWYLRNQILYGDLTGVRAFVQFRPEEGVAAIHDWADFRVFAEKMHRSFWGMFGWMNLPLPTWIYWAITAVYGLALIGIANALKKPGDTGHRATVGVFLVSLLVCYLLWVVLYGYQFGGSGWQGRYLFPALPAAALLLAWGLAALAPAHRRSIPMLSFGLTLLLVAAWVSAGVIAPAYARVTHSPAVLDQVQHPLDLNFADRIQLKGYDLAVMPSEQPEVSITLYWQVLDHLPADYKVFVHLVNLNWDLYGQGDDYPLVGQFPTSAWLPGDIVLDSHQVQFSQPVTAGEYRIAVGWYLEETGERLSILQGGTEIGTVAETAPFGLQP